jgi:predicted nucleotidyltransferase
MDRLTKTILFDLKNKILNKYKLVEMRLFGSTARGDRNTHSDIDIFVRIINLDRKIEEDIFDLAYEIELKHKCLIDIFVFEAFEYRQKFDYVDFEVPSIDMVSEYTQYANDFVLEIRSYLKQECLNEKNPKF